MAIPGGSMWSLSGYMTIGIWRLRGGAWELFTTRDIFIYETYTTTGQKTAYWGLNETFQLGSDVTDIGVSVEYSDGTAYALNGLTVTYQSQAAGGERSATANGGAATAVVRP